MRRFLPAIVLACWLLKFAGLKAAPAKIEPGPATPAELAAGEELAGRIRSAIPTEGSEFHGKLIIKSDGVKREVPIVCRVTIDPANWVTDYETAATTNQGAERLEVIHSTNGPNRYLYARAASPSAPLPPLAQVSKFDVTGPLAGSDFSLGDLGLDFLFWPVQRQLKNEMRLGQPCYVLESTNLNDGEIVRVKSDIDQESGGLLVAFAYDRDGHVVKEFSLGSSSFHKVHGRWQVEKMDISNKKTDSHTEIKFDLDK